MLAVPIVSSTKPQKMPAWISAGPRVPEHLGLDERVLDQADERAGCRSNGRDGAGGREDPQVAGHREHEERRRAPEHENTSG